MPDARLVRKGKDIVVGYSLLLEEAGVIRRDEQITMLEALAEDSAVSASNWYFLKVLFGLGVGSKPDRYMKRLRFRAAVLGHAARALKRGWPF